MKDLEYLFNSDLRFVVPAIATGRCISSCRISSKNVHVKCGKTLLSKEASAAKVLQLTREKCDSEKQYLSILECAKIDPEKEHKFLTVKQVERVAKIFRDILGKEDFPEVAK